MKFTFSLLVSLSLFASVSVRAEESKGDHPCVKLKAACEGAGFTVGGHKEGKGLMLDCMKKVIDGENVLGVSVAPADVAACKEKQATWKENRQERKMERAGRVGPGKASRK